MYVKTRRTANGEYIEVGKGERNAYESDEYYSSSDEDENDSDQERKSPPAIQRYFEDDPNSYNHCIKIAINYGMFVKGSVLPISNAQNCYFLVNAASNKEFVARHTDIFGHMVSCQTKKSHSVTLKRTTTIFLEGCSMNRVL